MQEQSCVINKLELYPLSEVKRRLKLNDAGIRTLRREGLPVIRIARRAYFSGEQLIEFLQQRATHGIGESQTR